jgi:hypothetical protein
VKVALVVLLLCLAACGASSKPSASTSTARTTPTRTSTSNSGVGVATARVNATLTAPNHSPVADKKWPYSVHVTDGQGKPLSGTVRIQFAFGGQVVGTDTPPVHPLTDGRWHDNLKFPRRSVGFPLTFQVVVHSSAGSVTLNWPVSVKP